MANNIKLISVNDSSKEVSYNYYENGAKKETILPDGSKETYLYYDDSTLKTLTQLNKLGEKIKEFSYSYDNNNNITQISDYKGVTSFTYDKLNRLSTAITPDRKKLSIFMIKLGTESLKR